MRAVGSERRLPRSGNAALAAGALIQAVLGVEFVLTGLSKVVDPHYLVNFRAFIEASPGSHRGLIAPLLQALVLPHPMIAAEVANIGELAIGVILLVAAAETARRRFSGRLGAQLGYEPAVALAGAAAGLGLAAISLTIFLIQGGALPSVNPARAFASAMPVELLMVPLGLGMAWLEGGRYLALRKVRSAPPATDSVQIEVLQAGTGVEQHHLIDVLEPSVGTQPAGGGDSRGALRTKQQPL